jgi:hypothetical protein
MKLNFFYLIPCLLGQTSHLKKEGENCSFQHGKSNCQNGLECTKTRKLFFFKKWSCKKPIVNGITERCFFKNPEKTLSTCAEGLKCTKYEKFRFFTVWRCDTDPDYVNVSVEGELCGLSGSEVYCEKGLECVAPALDNAQVGRCQKPIVSEEPHVSNVGEICDLVVQNQKFRKCIQGSECVSHNASAKQGTCEKSASKEGNPCIVADSNSMPLISNCGKGLSCKVIKRVGSVGAGICTVKGNQPLPEADAIVKNREGNLCDLDTTMETYGGCNSNFICIPLDASGYEHVGVCMDSSFFYAVG